DYRLRQSVARILTIPALDPALAPVVRALLREWSDRDSSRWRKLTAATAYGTEVGMLFPDTALRGLERIATGDDDDDLISLVVSYSITNLFEAGHQDEVLDALLAWTAPGRESRERTRQRVLSKNGLVAFFRIAKEGVVEPPPAQEGWPHFLAVSHGNASRMQRLVSLWRRALDTKPMARNALDVLRGWARKANYDQRLQEVLWSLVDALAETEQETERLTYNLRRWAEDTREPSRAAAYILEKLSQRGTRDVE
ncbi:MAG: hypothetical protein ACRDTT_07965, partial [Pseudonocardiaceae bacterium]